MMRCIARTDHGSRCDLLALRKFKARSGTSSVQALCGQHERRLLTGAKPLLEAEFIFRPSVFYEIKAERGRGRDREQKKQFPSCDFVKPDQARQWLGDYDIGIAVGMDKHPRGAFTEDPSLVGMPSWYAENGQFVTTKFFGMKANRYLHDHGISHRTLARVVTKNLRNGARKVQVGGF